MATVRTQAGSERFDKPIGSPLDDDSLPSSTETPQVASEVRLRSLRALIMSKISIDDEGAVGALVEKFRAELAEFSKGKTPAEVEQALSEPAKQDEPVAQGA